MTEDPKAPEGEIKAIPIAPAQASGFHLMGTGNDFLLLCQRVVPAVLNGKDIVGLAEPSAVLTISPQALKDLQVLIGKELAKFEKEFGAINTPFTLSVAKK
jgi:hypothetical protein